MNNDGYTAATLESPLEQANDPRHDKTNKMAIRPAKTQISLGIRPVWSVFTARSMGSYGPNVSSCGQRRPWSDWADAYADLSLRWTHSHFVGFFPVVD